MDGEVKKPEEYQKLIMAIQDALKSRDTKSAYCLISQTMKDNMNAPEPHNLLGIYYEMSGDDRIARNHYRAAYALDATYKPSCRNLSRLCSFYWGLRPRDFDYGDCLENEVTAQEMKG